MGVGLELAEGKLLELVHEAVHADALGQRRINVHGFARDAAAFVLGLDEVQRPHVVEAVGELDQQHADVVRHGEQELAEVLGLALAVGLRLDLRQFGDAIDKPGDIGAEQRVDLLVSGDGVLDGIVENRRGDGLVVELQFGEDAGDFDRVTEIRVTTGAQLAAVRLDREYIGAVEQILVRIGIIGFDALDEFILT